MIPDVSDEHLVKQVQAGNQEAFLTLYNRYLKKVYNRVKSRIPPQDAEDVTQEVFIAVVRSLKRFEQRSKFSTWLYTIVNRQIADFYRRHYRQNKNRVVSLESREQTEFLIDNYENIDEMIVIQQVLYKLPENYQEIILMRFADGLTFAEIAQKSERSLAATKSLYRRAIQAISKKVGKL